MGFKSTNKNVIIGILIVVVLIIVGAIVLLFKLGGFDSLVAKEKTDFESYAAFKKEAIGHYPDTLPEGASNQKYYYYMKDPAYKCALYMEIDKKNFIPVHKFYRDHYITLENGNDHADEKLTEEFIKSEGIDFLNTYINGEYSDFKILYNSHSEKSDGHYTDGVLYNRKAGKAIVYDCFIAKEDK